MADDYRVPPRSDAELHKIAKAERRYFGVADDGRVDIRACLKRGTVLTVRGEEQLRYRVLPDAELGQHDGLTTYHKGVVTISVRKTVDAAALVGEGRARNTLTHELGHAVLHQGPPMGRVVGARGSETPAFLRPFESAEHQTKVFGPAFLINDTIAEKLSSAGEISVQFGISLESALIYFRELTDLRNREISAENIARMADEFRQSVVEFGPLKVNYSDSICTNCGNRTLLPIGVKFLCDICGNVADQFQDGDPS